VLRPSQESFEELAKRGNWVPVVREILADMDTPLSLFRKLDDGHTSFLLESAEGDEKWGRFSFIGTGARALFPRAWLRRRVGAGRRVERVRAPGDPLEILRAKLAALRPVTLEGTKLPRFLGGAVGMVSYDWVRSSSVCPTLTRRDRMPDLWFVLPETIVVVDNLRKTAAVVRHVHVDADTDLGRAYRRRRRRSRRS
jgi:anthranilate synthase component 1